MFKPKQKSNLTKRVAFNSVVSSISKVLWTAVTMTSTIFITRLLGAEGYGEYTTVLAFLALFSALSDLGVNQITLREISKLKNEKQEKRFIANSFTLKLLVSALIVLLSVLIIPFIDSIIFIVNYFTGFFGKDPFSLNYSFDVRVGVFLVSIGLVFASLYQHLNLIFQKRLLAYKVSIAEFLGRLVNLGWVLVCYFLNLSLLFVILGLVFSWLATFIIVFFLTRRELKFKLKFNKKRTKKLLKASFPIGISVLITFVYFKTDALLLSFMKDFKDVGIYGAAYKVIESVAYFPGMFMGLITPIFARHIFKDRKKFKEIAKKVFDALAFIAIGLTFGIFSLSEHVIYLIGGSEFHESILTLQILAFSIIGLFIAQYFTSILIVSNLQKKTLVVFSICALVNVIFNLTFIPKFSYLAAAASTTITEVLVPIIAFYFVLKGIKFKPKFDAFFKLLVSGILMSAAIFYLEKLIFSKIAFFSQPDSFLSQAVITLTLTLLGGGFYLMLAFLLKAVSKKELLKIIRR